MKKYVACFILFVSMLPVLVSCRYEAPSLNQYHSTDDYEASAIQDDHVQNQAQQAQQETTLSDFHGRWQSYIDVLGDMIFDANDENSSVLMSLPEFGVGFLDVDWQIYDDRLQIWFNDETFRIIVTLDRHYKTGTFTQFGNTTEISFLKLSETPQYGDFARVHSAGFYKRIAELNEFLYFADDGTVISFTYDLNRRDLYMGLIYEFGLDELTAGHYDVDLMIVLMDWVKDNFRWNGNSGMPENRDAISIVDYLRRNPDGGNCRILAILLAELLRLYGIEAKHITGYPPEENHTVHVVTHAFSRELNQWIMLDSMYRLYLQDENGNFMNLYTLRLAFAEGTPLIVNHNAGKNDVVFCMVDYMNFMADYLFKFSTGTNFTFGSEEMGFDTTQFMLVPESFSGGRAQRTTTSADAFFTSPQQ